MKDSTTERLAERIKKLLALAGNNPSEAEAAAALERASAIMAEHNLTMTEVETFGSGDERVQDQYTSGDDDPQTWARMLWDAVAQLNFCFYSYYSRGRWRPNDVHSLIGTEVNVAASKAMVLYLIEAVERLAGEYRGARDSHAFKLGCAERLNERLRELRTRRMAERRENAPDGSRLPTLADIYSVQDRANQELHKKLYGRLPTGGVPLGTTRKDAFVRGKNAADSIGLDTQIRSGKQTLSLPQAKRSPEK